MKLLLFSAMGSTLSHFRIIHDELINYDLDVSYGHAIIMDLPHHIRFKPAWMVFMI